jgi:hypothetical protein
MGGGKSSGSSSSAPVVTQEQKDLLKAQTGFLTNTAFPAYQKTLGMANDVYGQVNPTATDFANTALNVAGQTGATQQAAGTAGTALGMAGLASLFNPQYEQGQVNAALQAGRESARESQAGQNAMYGGAGGLGSSRMALADRNLAGLNEQRQATAAASARAGVQANKAAAAQQLLSTGQGATGQAASLYGNLANQGSSSLAAANQAASARIGYSQTPQDVLGKYASIIYGTPQQSTTPNFQGTQGQTTSGKGMGFNFNKG